MTEKEILQRLGCSPDWPAHVPVNVFLANLKSLVAAARRQALYDAADDFEAGATLDDIRAYAERIE